jgi:spore maturation protein CgeB
MKILFALPGHLKTVPMGQYCVDALRALGHQVIPFDFAQTRFDRLWDRFGRLLDPSVEHHANMNKRLRALAQAERPDLFLTLFGFDISADTLASVRRHGIPCACWWINDPFQLERALKLAPHYDFLFSNSAGTLDAYRQAGVRNALFLPTACEPGVHRPTSPRAGYASEVCFAGDWSPLRERIMSALQPRFSVKIFGPWGKKIAPDSPLRAVLRDGFFTPQEMATMFSSSKVVLNAHTWFERFDHGVNPRLFEAAACGAYQIVDWKQEIPQLFDCTAELACYRSEAEIPSLIAHALAHPETHHAMSQASRQRALGEHTYRHRMETLLDHVAAG